MSERVGRELSQTRILFSGAGLDRASVERRDPDWLAAQRARDEARSLVLSDRGVWVSEGRLLLTAPNGDSLFLGLDERGPLFAFDATGAEPQDGRPAGLREAATELSADEAALSAYAASLLSWHRRHRFCANCGTPTRIVDAGHQRDCPSCGASHFPRTDPVVIVQVSDATGRLLLGRQARWPPGRFSVLAGFVEPGESLEEAVRREVLEESGVAVADVSYMASQPWPFPSSLMIGFRATATAGEPLPGDDELSEVRWFERSEVEQAARGEGAVALPPPYSISRRLIEDWLAQDLSGRSG
jgi:NAD+ diphosphatase